MKVMFVFAGALLATIAPAHAMSEADCAAAWSAADGKSVGYITADNGSRYHAAARVHGKTIVDGRISKDEFLSYCKSGYFDPKTVEPGAPLKGANSFTEAQAQDRAIAHGLTSVSGFTKDADGIWRGTGQSNGKQVNVSVDFKGNVVAQ